MLIRIDLAKESGTRRHVDVMAVSFGDARIGRRSACAEPVEARFVLRCMIGGENVVAPRSEIEVPIG
ncbi:hypothetical protein AB4851_12825 [Burkholderia sp. 22PA0099]|uniref:hypothetical protein n=1 Tax=Burkholderia sp. 22PA0099 TaxID=3237372 RepID=UPI0039C042DA